MSQIIHTENTRRKKEAEARRAGKKKKRKKRIRGFRYRNVSKQDLIQLREDTGNAITGCCGEDDFELPECFDCCASEGESETESTDEEEQGDGQRKGGKDARSEGGKSNHSRRHNLATDRVSIGIRSSANTQDFEQMDPAMVKKDVLL